MIYYQDSNFTIEWDDLTRIVIATSTGFVKGDLFRNPMDKITELLKEKRGHTLLNDLRAAALTDPADMEWLATNWVPRTVAAELRRSAMIMPPSVLAQMQMNRSVKSLTSGPEVRYFDNVDGAKAWLNSPG